MTAENESVKALRAIADALGTDVPTVLAMAEATAGDGAGHLADGQSETVMLMRLVRVWRALPDLESRRRALQLIEALTVRPLRID